MVSSSPARSTARPPHAAGSAKASAANAPMSSTATCCKGFSGSSGWASTPPRMASRERSQLSMKNTGRRDRVGHAQAAHVLLDARLALKVGDAGLAVGAADRAVDEVAHARRLGRVGERRALADLALRAAGLVVVLDGEDTDRARDRAVHGGTVGQVAADQGGAARGERLRGRFVGVAREGADGEAGGEQVAGDRAALLAGRAGDQDRAALVGRDGRVRLGGLGRGARAVGHGRPPLAGVCPSWFGAMSTIVQISGVGRRARRLPPTSVHCTVMISFLRPVASTAWRNSTSSQALICVRSISLLSVSTSLSAGMVGPDPLATLTVESTIGRR